MFQRLVGVVAAFDQSLRRGFANQELDAISGMLGRLQANASATDQIPD